MTSQPASLGGARVTSLAPDSSANEGQGAVKVGKRLLVATGDPERDAVTRLNTSSDGVETEVRIVGSVHDAVDGG